MAYKIERWCKKHGNKMNVTEKIIYSTSLSMHYCKCECVLNIGLYDVLGSILVHHLVSVLFTPPLVAFQSYATIFLVENVFIDLFH